MRVDFPVPGEIWKGNENEFKGLQYRVAKISCYKTSKRFLINVNVEDEENYTFSYLLEDFLSNFSKL